MKPIQKTTPLRNLNARRKEFQKYWTIYGKGRIGEKARQLMIKQHSLIQAGFHPIPRIVLAMDFFKEFEKTRNFTPEQLSLIKTLAKKFKGIPIVVRSSAYDDASGTGIYESVFCSLSHSDEENTNRLLSAILDVHSSQFSKDAIAFRQKKGSKPGMAVMIEPVAGNLHRHKYMEEDTYIAPVFSGIGFTSTSYSDAYILAVRGIPILAVNGIGLRFEYPTRSDSFTFEGREVGFQLPDSSLGRKVHQGYSISPRSGRVDVRDLTGPYPNVQPLDLLERLQLLEEIVGTPQYLEWALMVDELRKPIFVPLQINDATPQNFVFEFPEKTSIGKTLQVIGQGEVECIKVVELYGLGGSGALARFNDQNSNYLLLYSGSILRGSRSSNVKLPFSFLSNASALVELGGEAHTTPTESHFGVRFKEVGIIFVRLDRRIRRGKLVASINKSQSTEDFNVYDISAKVIASERQQKALVIVE